MPTDDRQILVVGAAPAPALWTVPGNGQVQPKAIFAQIDGSGAGSAFFPVVKIVSDGGEVVCICPTNVTVAAGGSAVVSWFPHVAASESQGGSGGGPVESVSAGDTSIHVGYTDPANPTVTTGALDQIATLHPPAGDWSNASHKVTDLANGTAAQDAAAFGQIPTSLPPSGSAGGDLTGTYPNPTVRDVSILSAKGDLLVRGTSAPATRLPVGTDTFVLTADHTAANGVAWAAAPSASGITDLTSTGSTITVTNPTGPTTNVDLPASGVTAATYGDASHVGQVAVNAEGIITTASSVAIAITEAGLSLSDVTTDNVSTARHGFVPKAPNVVTQYLDGTGAFSVPGTTGGTGITTLLYDSGKLVADAASIDTGAGGISTSYTMIVIWVTVRTDDAGVTGTVNITLNNDGLGHYDVQEVSGINATAAAAAALGGTSWPFAVHGSGGGASYASIIKLEFPNYSDTTFFKTALSSLSRPDSTAANNKIAFDAFAYRSTTAISRFAIAASGAAKLKAGSRVVIYGQ